jgi:very-short-patch-repair endonuclease
MMASLPLQLGQPVMADHYPILLIPSALQAALQASPQAEIPPLPSRCSGLILVSAGIGGVFLLGIFGQLLLGNPIDPLMWTVPLGSLAVILWELPRRWHSRASLLRLRQAREARHQAILQDPQQLRQWRQHKISLILKSCTPVLLPSKAKSGKYDDRLFRSLSRLQGIQVWQKHSLGFYTPDVIVHDPRTNLWIDVEIDDPWFTNLQTGIPTPNHTQGSDDRRNRFFLDQGWIVIRFAEEQVALHHQSCLKVVAGVLDRFDLSGDRLAPFRSVADLVPIPTWNHEDALKQVRY